MTSDVHELQQAFIEAERRADTTALRALPADDFRSIGDQGSMLDKAQWLGKFGDFAYTSLRSSDVEVTGYDRAAIVRYVQRSSSVWRGQEMASTTRVSQTWIEQAAGWRLAGMQFSPFGNV
ncbi:nuclear transport factor 2 family protein [Symbioplanes lichenis]|uniref:nuclear transport factor 2 family protein n=1 Tax=Symbioplanes lichenis TaxID=1629072 RepID=UPI002738DCB5|nr:nuclear transport factor 2 family protein [Actinoplanes lichenis]